MLNKPANCHRIENPALKSRYRLRMSGKSTTAELLLIDDDRELAQMLRDYLAAEHISLTACGSGEAGLEKLAAAKFDLVVLDIMLPGISGLDVLKDLRQRSDIPVIMLTARGEEIDRILGLEFGADDYLAKPFNPRELLARVKAILRRAQPGGESRRKWELGSISLDLRTRTAAVNGTALNLTGTEFEILRCLLETPGQVVSKEHLSKTALGRRLLPYDRSIDTHISNLRSKLERAGNSHETIRNQRGIGYLLIPGAERGG